MNLCSRMPRRSAPTVRTLYHPQADDHSILQHPLPPLEEDLNRTTRPTPPPAKPPPPQQTPTQHYTLRAFLYEHDRYCPPIPENVVKSAQDSWETTKKAETSFLFSWCPVHMDSVTPSRPNLSSTRVFLTGTISKNLARVWPVTCIIQA